MAKSYEKYEELTNSSVAHFASSFLEEEALGVDDISDGNINRVFRVFGKESSVIIKQALPYLRVAGTSWPLTRHRAQIENDAIGIHSELVPGIFPKIIHFNSTMSTLIMEDLRGYSSWRESLINGVDLPHVPEIVGNYASSVLIGTSESEMEASRQNALRNKFVYSELCIVTEKLFFTDPYLSDSSNRYDEEISEIVREFNENDGLRKAASEMRTIFKSKNEALIHGDLHSGAVMVSEQDAKIIDLEFAFFGPFGFDPGVLLANLALSFISHEVLGNDDFAKKVDSYARIFWVTFQENFRLVTAKQSHGHSQVRKSMLEEMARFAGMEMIRRIIGLAHAKEIELLPIGVRKLAQVRALENGRKLLTGPAVESFEEIWEIATGKGNK